MNTLECFFLDHIWSGLLVWSALYISDYRLTLACARLYSQKVSKSIAFEGSFEITPYFQSDIDSLRVVSPRFLAAMVVSWVYLAAVWWLAAVSQPCLYQFVLGAMISSELAIHVRHVRNLYLFRAIVASSSVHGRIEYPRPLVLRMSAAELLAFSVLFGIVSVFTASWFLVGGAAACLGIALKHRRLADRHVAGASARVATVQTS